MTDHDCIEEVRTKLIRYCLLQEKCTHETPCDACAPFVRTLALAKITADEIAGIAPKFMVGALDETTRAELERLAKIPGELRLISSPKKLSPSFLTLFRTKAHAGRSD